ncbi:MAG: T9SS type A sorting domain-containing protein [Ignavibacteriales bacterium]|nr:T9SS type A sorting domain-containing protein [Ignavibacteriales bacterium]
MNVMCASMAIDTDSVRFRPVRASGAVVTWLLVLVFFCCAEMLAQSIYIVPAPPADGSTTGLRVPNGTIEHAYHRTVMLVDTPSLKLVPAGMKVTRLGFVVNKGAGAKVDGNLTMYLSNKSPLTIDLSTIWSQKVGNMTKVYAGPFTIPDTAGPVDVTLSAPFQYLGRGMYVAYEFQSSGPFTTQNAVFASNTSLAAFTLCGFSSTEMPAVLNDVSDFRPVIRFAFPIPALQWNKITSGAQMDLNGLDIVDDLSAWVCSPAGNAYRTIDLGNTWIDAGRVPDSAIAILTLNSETALAVAGKESEPSALYSTSDAGKSWSRLSDPALTVRIAVAGKTSSFGLWCLGGGVNDTVNLLTSSSLGSNWVRSSTGIVLEPGVRVSRGSGFRIGNVVWFGTRGSGSSADRVYKSSTGPGGPWRYSSTGRTNVAALAFASASGTGIAAHIGCMDTICRSTDGGLTWSTVVAAGLGEVSSLQYYAGGQDAWAATSTGIWRTSDDGITWQRSFASGSSSQTLSSIRFFPNFQSGLAIGLNGLIVRGSWIVNAPVAVLEAHSQPEGYRLGLNYPNPFNGRTWIEFSLPRPSRVTLTMFDVLGREIVTLASGERGTGTHRVEWNSAGNPSGVYFYRLHARAISGGNDGDYVETLKLILLK